MRVSKTAMGEVTSRLRNKTTREAFSAVVRETEAHVPFHVQARVGEFETHLLQQAVAAQVSKQVQRSRGATMSASARARELAQLQATNRLLADMFDRAHATTRPQVSAQVKNLMHAGLGSLPTASMRGHIKAAIWAASSGSGDEPAAR